MVSYYKFLSKVWWVLPALLYLYCTSVNGQIKQETGSFSRFSFSLQGLTYLKGHYNTTEGSQSIKSKLMYSGQIGIKYNILSTAKGWNLSTGLYIGWPPVYNFEFEIDSKELYPSDTEDLLHYSGAYSFYSFSVPLTVEYVKKISSKNFLSISSGLQLMRLQTGSAQTSVVSVNDDNPTEEKEVFRINASNAEPGLYLSGIIEVGDYIQTKAGLFYIGLQFNKSFQTLFSGEYMFGNLAVSPDTRGTYKFSGDYLALTLRYTWRKKRAITSGNN